MIQRGKAILQNILLFIWPVVYSSEETKRERKKGGKERRKEEKSLNAGESIK